MADLSVYTRQMQAMMPQWMVMAKEPTSVGAQFLNVFGLEFDDVKSYIEAIQNDQYIGTANIGEIDIIYKVPITIATLLDIDTLDTVTLFKKSSTDPTLMNYYDAIIVSELREFYSADVTSQSVCMLDRTESLLYVRVMASLMDTNVLSPFDIARINGADHYEYTLHSVWNAFDEFGLLLGLQRLYAERNAAFKDRILDVFKKPGNSTKQGLINALSRELGIDVSLVNVNEMVDKAFKGTLINEDGTPTKKLMSYVEQVNKVLGFTWDNMTWGEAYWRSIEETNIGFDYLPHVWDASMDMWQEADFQSGIGDADDLLVRAPEKLSNTREFSYYVGLRGRKREGSLVYPEHSFKYKITASGQILSQMNKPEVYKYTVIASEIINIHFILRGYKAYTITQKVDFTANNYTFDDTTTPHVEIVDGTTMMSLNPDSQYLEVSAELTTSTNADTPSIDKLIVTWLDSANASHTLTLDTQADFDGTPHVTVTKTNTVTTTDGFVQLGFGSFDHVIDTEADWNTGTTLNVTVLPSGSIKLGKA